MTMTLAPGDPVADVRRPDRHGRVKAIGCETAGGCRNDRRGGCIEVVWADAKGAARHGLYEAAADLQAVPA